MMDSVKSRLVTIYVGRRDNVKFHKGARVNRATRFEGNNTIFPGTLIYSSVVGRMTYFGANCRIRCTKVGRFCSIADRVSISLGLHPSKQFVSTFPAFYNRIHPAVRNGALLFQGKHTFQEHKYLHDDPHFCCSIGNDVWIGDDVKIMDGVRIGDGVIIGTASVVTKTCEPFGVYVGSPAKLVRFRFTEVERAYLAKLQWWSQSDTWIAQYSKYFGDISDLMKNVPL